MIHHIKTIRGYIYVAFSVYIAMHDNHITKLQAKIIPAQELIKNHDLQLNEPHLDLFLSTKV